MKGKLYLDVAVRSGRTILEKSYLTPPFKIADISLAKQRDPLHLMIMSSSPGILDGDEYEIVINVGEMAALDLATQSFQRLFRMKTGASQHTAINLKSGSCFSYLPNPVVPHEHSIFRSTNRINIEAGAQLIWGEVITCGRALNGEKFKFSSFESLTEVYYSGRIVMKENIKMIPGVGNIQGMGMLEGFTHQASMVCLTSNRVDLEKVHLVLSEFNDIEYGLSETRINGFVLRILGNAAYKLHEILEKVALSFDGE